MADYVVLTSPVIRSSRHVYALADNLAHGVVAIASWLAMCGVRGRQDLLNALLCGFIACAIDVDHFVCARSFYLKVRAG